MRSPLTNEDIDEVALPIMTRAFRRAMFEDCGNLRIYPGARLPSEFEPVFVDIPASTKFPVDWSKTRWPEGAEL